VTGGGYELVLASSDSDLQLLVRERDRIPALVPYPPEEAVRGALDKGLLAEAALRAGLAVPETAGSGAEARERFGGRPFVVKERLHGSPGSDGRPTHLDPLLTADPGEADRRAAEIAAAGGTPLIQEAVAGRLTAFSSVAAPGGLLLARVQQEAERTWPRALGCSVRARTVAVDEDLAARVAALLDDLAWTGLSEIQFLRGADGVLRLIDFNGRFYGSLALALAAGPNLPALAAALATGRPTDGLGGDGAPGVRYQWLEGDLRAARERSRGLARDAAGCLRYAVGARHSVWRASDPLPAARVALALLAERVPGRRR
jgi:predicted ATP-grasp superfamily ATP-dependent carboligase